MATVKIGKTPHGGQEPEYVEIGVLVEEELESLGGISKAQREELEELHNEELEELHKMMETIVASIYREVKG